MKITKFLFASSILTCICLLYVYQQTEIFRFAYSGHKKVVAFEDLLDKNTVLRYNIKKSGSLIYIGSKISQVADFEMPTTYQRITLAYRNTHAAAAAVALKTKKENMLSRVFEIRSQAEANTVFTGQASERHTEHR